MKIKTDFVTNSSSTSFILTCEAELTEEEFLKLIGISSDSPLLPIFQKLYALIKREMKSLSNEKVDQLITDSHPNVSKKIADAKQLGRMIYAGKLGSEDGDVIEGYFCTDSFEIENEHFYFNYLDCLW